MMITSLVSWSFMLFGASAMILGGAKHDPELILVGLGMLIYARLVRIEDRLDAIESGPQNLEPEHNVDHETD